MFKGKSNEGFLAYLESKKSLTMGNAHVILETLTREGLGVVKTILELGLLPEADLADHLTGYLRIKKMSADEIPEVSPQLSHLNARYLRERHVFPLGQSSSGMTLAMLDPLDCATLKMMVVAVEQAVIPRVATRSQLNQLLDRFLPEPNSVTEGVPADTPTTQLARQLKSTSDDTPAVRLVNQIMDKAVLAGASDIHLDVSMGDLEVRYRIDGILEKQPCVSVDDPREIISRIKVVAGMDIAEKRLPQDGRTRIVSGGREIDLRLASIPVVEGESITIRLLNNSSVPLNLDGLGFSSQNLKRLRDLLSAPNGLVLVTGPTGSGKTTTLYAALQEKIDGKTKIISIEDPVEFKLNGVTQVSINSSIGLSFPKVLRASLRHDPDIILIGEIRDRETAEIAVRAALTGHLVLATLHTNSAASAIGRLLDMGVADYLITAAVRGAIAQRLVRSLGDAAPTGERQYRGRSAVSEVLTVSPALNKLVLRGADVDEIEQCARSEGMATMNEDGKLKVRSGVTTNDELARVSLSIVSQDLCA